MSQEPIELFVDLVIEDISEHLLNRIFCGLARPLTAFSHEREQLVEDFKSPQCLFDCFVRWYVESLRADMRVRAQAPDQTSVAANNIIDLDSEVVFSQYSP